MNLSVCQFELYKDNNLICPLTQLTQNYIYHGIINIYYPSIENVIAAILIVGLIILLKKWRLNNYKML